MKLTKYLFCYWLFVVICALLTACDSKTPSLKPLSPEDVIVAFGDSLTYGTGAPKEMSYPALLERILGIRVINEGIPGEETIDGLARINDVLDKYHPKLVILCLGGNDQIRKRQPEQIKDHLKKIITIIRKTGADVLLIAVPKPSLTLSVPDLYAELGEELDIPVDTTTLANLLNQQNKKSDYIHLNAAGYQALANAIAHLIQIED